MLARSKLSKNRQLLGLYLERARSFHAVSNVVCELDVTRLWETLARRRERGLPADFHACLVKATALVVERHPQLNRHLFHGIFGGRTVADFGEVSCNFMVLRKEASGEPILLPVVVRNANLCPVEEISAQLRHHREAPLESLPGYAALSRLKRLPSLLFRLLSFVLRSSPRFYLRHAGTYGISSVVKEGAPPGRREDVLHITHTLATSCVGFFPSGLYAASEAGTERVMLVMACTFDHFLVDGHDVMRAVAALRALLASPEQLGLS